MEEKKQIEIVNADDTCDYNSSVICGCHQCEKCGWHPQVETERKRKLRGE